MTTATSAARRPRRVSGRERGLALGSLACGLLLAVAIVAFVLRNLGWLALALVGLALAVGGLWWAMTERMPRRGLGIVGGVGGVVLIALTRDLGHAPRRPTAAPSGGDGRAPVRCRRSSPGQH